MLWSSWASSRRSTVGDRDLGDTPNLEQLDHHVESAGDLATVFCIAAVSDFVGKL